MDVCKNVKKDADSGASNVLRNSKDIQFIKSYEKRVSHLVFQWIIEYLSTLTIVNTQAVTSPTFTLKLVPSTWFVKHTPGVFANRNRCSRFHLCRPMSDTGPQTVLVTYRLGMKVHYEQKWFPEKRSISFRPGDESYVDIDVREYFRNEFILDENKVTIFCEMYVTLPESIAVFYERRLDQLHLGQDIFNCILESKWGDIKFRVKDLQFLAHKAILSARSPTFKHLCMEPRNCIVLNEEDYDHIRALLSYIYSGNPYLALHNRDLCIGLFECAKRYRVRGLQELLTPVDITARTSVTDESAEYIWILQRFGSLIKENKLINMTSPSFPDNSKIIPKCTLKIYLNSELHATDSLGIHFKAVEQMNALYLKISVSILDHNMHTQFKQTKDGAGILFQEHDFSDYIDRTKLLENPEFLQNDQMVIRCRIELTVPEESLNEIKTFDSFPYDEHFKILSSDYQNLLQDGSFSDVNVVIDNEIFNLHNVFLAMRCPELESRLKEGEDTESVIGITDLSEDLFSEMVSYMYTGNISKTEPDFLMKLIKAAELYKMRSLQYRCYRLLPCNLDRETVCNVITFAHNRDNEELMAECLNYVSCNKREIFASLEWKNLIESQSDLAALLLQWMSNLRVLQR